MFKNMLKSIVNKIVCCIYLYNIEQDKGNR